ncbi:MAG: hypothetical protein KGY54_12990 [Oleiphilaceae bacterium]|nr:hypothetical protein [Oleiphilaceae bacterium]
MIQHPLILVSGGAMSLPPIIMAAPDALTTEEVGLAWRDVSKSVVPFNEKEAEK